MRVRCRVPHTRATSDAPRSAPPTPSVTCHGPLHEVASAVGEHAVTLALRDGLRPPSIANLRAHPRRCTRGSGVARPEVTSSGSGSTVVLGGVLEIVVALAGIGTAVVLYPVVRRQGEARALGFVGARTLEAACIFIGVATLVTLVALRRAGAGPEVLVTGRMLVAFYDSLFVISQGFIPAVNALLLGTLLYQSRLVPRDLPGLGLVGAVLIRRCTVSRGPTGSRWRRRRRGRAGRPGGRR